MLLNILKCDSCKKDFEYTCKNDYKISNEDIQIGRVFKIYRNEVVNFEHERWITYHLCNKCFDTLKENLDFIINDFIINDDKHDSCDV